ncbi:hypothetical protein RF11_13150 [Thelohanellus kitauei]|uniref:Uncharacterized protein n=1 Tax=Thelohanellus kitauei TaxID=669202 RepID=A0A0C2JNS6_THEKT|nr:hypothetical protein RF11_13150 [Thelohanellus kitauei]
MFLYQPWQSDISQRNLEILIKKISDGFLFLFDVLKMDISYIPTIYNFYKIMNLELFSCRKHKSSYSHRTCDKIYEGIRTIFVATDEAATSIATISNYENSTRSTVSSILHKFRKGASVEKNRVVR